MTVDARAAGGLVNAVERAARPLERALCVLFLAGGIFHLLPVLDRFYTGFYASANWQAFHGALPYRDFMFMQAPLASYLFAPAQLAGARAAPWLDALIALAFGLAALVTTMRLARRLAGPLAGVVAGLAMVGTFLFVTESSEPTPISALAFLVAASAAALASDRSLAVRYGGAGALLGLATGLRVSLVVALGLLVLHALYAQRGRAALKAAAWAALAGGLVVAIVYAPFLMLARDSFVFGLVGFHRIDGTGVAVGALQGVKYRLDGLAYFARAAPFALGAFLASVLVGGWALRTRAQSLRAHENAWLFLHALPFAILAPMMLKTYIQAYWLVIALPPIAVVAGAFVAKLIERTPDRAARDAALLLVVGIVAVQLAGAAPTSVFAPTPADALSIHREVGDLLAARLGPGEEVLTFVPALAYRAGLDVVRGAEMGDLALYPTLSIEEAERLHVMSHARIEHVLATDPPAAIVLSEHDLTATVAPSLRVDAQAEAAYLARVHEILQADYVLAGTWGEGERALHVWLRAA